MLIFLNIFTCISSLSIIAYIMYLRLHRKIHVIALDADNISNYVIFFRYLLIIAIFWLSFILIIWLLQVKFSKTQHQKNYKFLLLLTFWYNRLNIFYKSYGILFDWFGPSYTTYLVRLARKFLNWKPSFKIALIVSFSVLPRVIIILVLCYDIHARLLHYYFYSLLLLFIPLIFKFFVFILKDIGPRLLPEFRKFLDIDTSLNDIHFVSENGPQRLKPISIKFKKEFEDIDLDYFMRTFFYPMSYIGGEMSVYFLPIYSKIVLSTLIFYYLFHGLAWAYILTFLA